MIYIKYTLDIFNIPRVKNEDYIGMTGFEPAASCSQSRRATKLRYIPEECVSTRQHIQFCQNRQFAFG